MERKPSKEAKVQVSETVFEGLDLIRSSGVTNMLDRPMVQQLAWERGLEETAQWLEQIDSRTYGRLIFQGVEVIDGDIPDEQPDRQNGDEAYEPLEPRNLTDLSEDRAPKDDPSIRNTSPERLPSRNTLSSWESVLPWR